MNAPAAHGVQALPEVAPTRFKNTLVLGIGNPLMGDDGAGIRAVEMLEGQKLPPDVEVADAGAPGWGLPAWFEGRDKVILIDAVRMGEKPGCWLRFRPEDIRLMACEDFLSLHEPGLANGLALAEALGLLPDQVVLYGIEPGKCEVAADLSPAVRDCLVPLIESLLSELWNGNKSHEL